MQWKPHKYADHRVHSPVIYNQPSKTEVKLNVWVTPMLGVRRSEPEDFLRHMTPPQGKSEFLPCS